MYKVGIIGLGHIAAWYGDPQDPNAYCHAGGILHSDQVELSAVCEISPTARERFRKEWGDNAFPDVRYFDSAAELLSAQPLDIIAVCVRGPYHYPVMKEVLSAAPKAVFLEKPPTCSLAEMDELTALAQSSGTLLTVSYSRHWSPHVMRLQQLVSDGLIGEVRHVVGYTGGDVLSFASHSTDLICQFAGSTAASVYAVGDTDGQAPEGFEVEPRMRGMMVSFANGVTGIQIGTKGSHGDFYCEVFGTKGMVRAGIYIPPYAETHEGGALDLTAYGIPEERSVFTVAYNQIADYLDGGPLPHCSDESFMAVNEIGFAAIESIYSGLPVKLPNVNRSRKVYANG